MQALSRFGVCATILLLAACAGPPGFGEDPMETVRNPRQKEERRAKAIDAAWDRVLEGKADRTMVREELKTLAWSASWPEPLRIKALNTLLSDTDPEGEADSRQLVKLMLPREQSLEMIRVLCEGAAQHGWEDTVPSMVRSLSRSDAATPDTARPEYRAIARLRPESPVPGTVMALFLDPPAAESGYGANTPERVRADAWDVLARLDPSADLRASMIAGAEKSDDPAIASLRACLADLHTLPRAGDELVWLWSLRDPADRLNAAWWAESAGVIRPLYNDRGRMLELRHIEPIRWSARGSPVWIAATRAELVSIAEDRLAGRTFHRRTERDPGEPIRSESLTEQADRLDWGDLVTILVLDDAVHEPAAVSALFAQADMDRADHSAEYGGLVEAWALGPVDGAPPFRVVLYPPRPSQRRGDREFVASADMIDQGDRSLAHYHFHVQESRNAAFAGPSTPDLAYAARLGRTCLVFTSIGPDTLDADLYQPDGVIIDLGELHRP